MFDLFDGNGEYIISTFTETDAKMTVHLGGASSYKEREENKDVINDIASEDMREAGYR